MVILGERIKSVRLSLNMKQGDFAHKLGLGSATAISRYEKEQREPDIAVLVKIAILGNIDLTWLITGEGPKERGAVEPEVLAVKESVSAYGQPETAFDPTVASLTKKLDTIYKEGNRKDRAEVRGLIDEIYDDLKKNGVDLDEEEPLKKTGNH